MTAVFDTNILVDFLNGIPQALPEIDRHESRFISIMTWIEVLVGCRNDVDEAAARNFMREFTVVDVPSRIAERAVTIRRERRLKLPDAVVLATALEMDCPLLTRNTKDFPADDPDIVVPYRL